MEPAERVRLSAFASLRIRNYRLYAAGQTVSVVGTWMQNVALAWFTLQISHSAALLGIVSGARYLPVLVLGPWGGLVADRCDKLRLLTVTQVCLGTLSALLAVLSWLHLVTSVPLLLIVLALGVTSVFDNPSRQSLISELVDARHLANAIALNSTTVNVAKLIGPTVAGGVIAAVGVTPCFAINAISFAAVIASLLLMRSSELYPAVREVRAHGQIREGVSYVCRTPDLLYPMLMVVVTGIFTWEFPVSLPVLMTQTFRAGPAGYGVATACMSLGGVVGGFLAARRTQLNVRSLAVSALLWGGVIAAASLEPRLALAFIAFVLVGLFSVTFNSSAKTLLQIGSAPRMRGRVMSLWAIAWQGGTAIGAPVIGAVAGTLGPRYGLLLGAVAAAAIGAIVLIMDPGSA